MRRLRVLIIVPEHGLVPDNPDAVDDKEQLAFKATFDVSQALDRLGHTWDQLGLSNEIAPLRERIETFKPTIVFNLLDQFRSYTYYDQHVVSYLKLLRVPVTGCHARGLMLASDKGLSKRILSYHRVRAPGFQLFPIGRRTRLRKRLTFPLIVKVHLEEASMGIAQTSIVRDEEQLRERVRFVHEKFSAAANVEEYIEGRELNVGVVGNQRLIVLPPWELFLDKLPPNAPRIATEKVKWDLDYQEKYDVRLGPARKLPGDVAERLAKTTRRVYRALNLSGYARIDYRLNTEDRLFFLEANANPDISEDEELASAAQAAGLTYDELIQKVLNLGLRWSRTP